MNFKINLTFTIKPFFLLDQNLNTLRTKRPFKMKQKWFFIIFEGLSLKQIKHCFEGESPTLNKTEDEKISFKKMKINWWNFPFIRDL